MKLSFSPALVGMIFLSGCVSSEFYVKQGVSADRYERDGVGCATAAAQAVPTNTQVAWAPYVGIYSVDTNNVLRDKNMEICMRDRGYQRVPVPYCAGTDVTKATEMSKRPRDPNKMMHVTADSCYILDGKGAPFLYTP